MPACLPACLPARLSIHLSAHLPAYPTVHPSVCLSVCPSVRPPVHPLVCGALVLVPTVSGALVLAPPAARPSHERAGPRLAAATQDADLSPFATRFKTQAQSSKPDYTILNCVSELSLRTVPSPKDRMGLAIITELGTLVIGSTTTLAVLWPMNTPDSQNEHETNRVKLKCIVNVVPPTSLSNPQTGMQC